MMRPRILFCGEALIDFITTDGENYRAHPGGSPYSASKAAARAGGTAAFCGAVSTDIFGKQIMADLDAYGVDTSLVPRSDDPTVLGFVKTVEDQHPQYAFFDRDSTMVNMAPALPMDSLPEEMIFCVGSISLITAPGADNIADFAIAMKKHGLLALDPNVRPTMIAGHKAWKPRMDRLIDQADIIKASTEDLEFYAPNVTAAAFARSRLEASASLVIVTDGERGASCWTKTNSATVPTVPVFGGDTVGAGDTLFGYVLARLEEFGALSRVSLAKLTEDQLCQMLKLAITAAGLNCAKVGCQPPCRNEVEHAMRTS